MSHRPQPRVHRPRAWPSTIAIKERLFHVSKWFEHPPCTSWFPHPRRWPAVGTDSSCGVAVEMRWDQGRRDGGRPQGVQARDVAADGYRFWPHARLIGRGRICGERVCVQAISLNQLSMEVVSGAECHPLARERKNLLPAIVRPPGSFARFPSEA
jgi:hypothetical protein